ncbi:Sec-independent protein translocase subunit TatA [Homoserinibacter sp. YIM 151385]|uniref:Sec-independent protein translocase subunit TatA n=1 Tax=Homoserinibacter sp. YIM 151385 TaxID=2985506 RepID=UPI0022EFF41F|nr:Sec-independent protein translocase subunit TatA [Homoserinibacter sp. YIM 151385]WBU38549.1 Sec-independent protein translocase subunit TatA [Homoserinibacter sp. YIM 151385]
MGIFGNTFTGWHLVVVLLVILLLFGATRLPALARSLGQSTRIFRSEIKSMKDDKGEETAEGTADGVTRNEAGTTAAARDSAARDTGASSPGTDRS